PPSMRARADSHAAASRSAAEQSESAQPLRLASAAAALASEPEQTTPGAVETGSGPRASARPSAVPFMDRAADSHATAEGAAGPDLAAPGSMSEALLRASQLPD